MHSLGAMKNAEKVWFRMVGVLFPISALVMVWMEQNNNPRGWDALPVHYWLKELFVVPGFFIAAGILGSLLYARRVGTNLAMGLLVQSVVAELLFVKLLLEAFYVHGAYEQVFGRHIEPMSVLLLELALYLLSIYYRFKFQESHEPRLR